MKSNELNPYLAYSQEPPILEQLQTAIEANAMLIAENRRLKEAVEACRAYIENDHGIQPRLARMNALAKVHALIAKHGGQS